MVIKGKIEELLVIKLKTSERNMQDFNNSIKRPNLRIMGIEGEVMQTEGICNIFNKIITGNSKFRENNAHSGTGSLQDTRLDQNRSYPQHVTIKTTSTEYRERILKAAREKKQVTYSDKPTKITAISQQKH
jgi:hypothetical protein